MTEHVADILRAVDGSYICDFCGESYLTEAQARSCSQADREQFLLAQAERELVQAVMSY